ncbi:aspartyl protease family protein 2-like [Melia azedarach]|uniref:Aspartyl protease family protein 2-like n=1 Tax=Melia azedarach TaxID=155640 RepID=A0ACC1X332_MELAZ|nr:aspartyl protease family protein 2-like [Melia azedarach]
MGRALQGIFVNETVTVGLEEIHRKIRLKDVIVGCSDWSKGSFHDADGVMGLGYGKHSFAVKAAKLFGNKFSYCLVDHLSPSNLANFLNFGNATSQTLTLKNMQHTQLILGVINPFYAVNVSGISVAGKMLDIPSEVWNVEDKGGVIVDSGSTLAFLVQPAYLATMIALTSPLKNSKRSAVRSGPLEFCYEEAGFELELVPEFAWHFTDGAKFVPPVKSYVIDAAEGVKCFAFASAEWPGTSVIGNIMQQNHLVGI